ncbi:MAG: hypothetical protein ACMG6H_13575 [Acidobacteriota bacterium]
METFQELGELVERYWRAENYSEQLFPEIAAQALAEADLPSRVDPWEIIRGVLTAPTLPEQHDVEGRFGDPPVTLYSGSRFYIDIYYWLDGTTSIHQHAFTGAFQVLRGSSIHSRYSFREDRILSEHFSVGELELKDVQLLQKNDVRKILPGRQLIHSLFHLDRPSATITIRTQSTPSVALQYDYRKPHFAMNPFFRNPVMAKKLQAVGLLLAMPHQDADELIGDLVCSSDFHTAYFVLAAAYRHLNNDHVDALFGLSTGKDRFKAILERCRSVHGELTDLVMPVFAEEERQGNIVHRRATITGEEHRFFLALLLNVSNREKVLNLVKQRFPERDPVETILDWVEELARTRVVGSNEMNALGIMGFDDAYVVVLEYMLRGSSSDEITEQASRDLPRLCLEQPSEVEKIRQVLSNVPLFKSILA